MFRGQGFQYSTVRVQSTRPVKPHAILLRRRRQKLVPAISPSLVLVIGVAIAGVMAIFLGMSG